MEELRRMGFGMEVA